MLAGVCQGRKFGGIGCLRPKPLPLFVSAHLGRMSLGEFALRLLLEAVQLAPGLEQPGILLEHRNRIVELGDGAVFAQKEAVWLQHVIDRRDEVGMVVTCGQITRKGGQKANRSPSVPDNEHAEHLTGRKFVAPLSARSDVGLHARRGGHAERVGTIAEGAGKTLGKRCRVNLDRQAVQRPRKVVRRGYQLSGNSHDATPPPRSRVCSTCPARPRPAPKGSCCRGHRCGSCGRA